MAEVILPQLGETVTEGTITQFFKKVGDTVSVDEALFEVSTDKVDTEVPSPVSGVVLEIRVAEGETVDVGTVIAVVGDSGSVPAAPAAPPAAPPAEPASQPTEQAAPPAPAAAPPPPPPAAPRPEPEVTVVSSTPATPASTAGSTSSTAGDKRLLSPVVRRLVNEHGLDPDSIIGTGPGGRITREDVLDHIDALGSRPAPAVAASAEPARPAAPAEPAPAEPARPASPAPATASVPALATGGRETAVPLSKIRRLTGDHMVSSKSISPHAFSVVEVDYANVDRVRRAERETWRQTEGFGLTYLPFIARALVDGLAEFPHLNASLTTTDLIVHGYVDLGIAVDLGYEGLLAPVVRNADSKRLRAIAREIHDLAERAKTRKLLPDEIQGGTFTISNNGSAGSVLTMPIINQPQVAIVSTDAIVRKPVVVATVDGDEAIVVHPVGNLAMSWDHRAFDGAYAAGFLKRVKEILETRDWSNEL